MTVTINGVKYSDWQLSFNGCQYKILACRADTGTTVLVKDYGSDSQHAYLDFDEIIYASKYGEEVNIT